MGGASPPELAELSEESKLSIEVTLRLVERAPGPAERFHLLTELEEPSLERLLVSHGSRPRSVEGWLAAAFRSAMGPRIDNCLNHSVRLRPRDNTVSATDDAKQLALV